MKKGTNQSRLKQQIFDAAESLFISFGYHGTSIRMIAERAKVNSAMINYYFLCKEKLFEEVLDRVLKRIRKCIVIFQRSCAGQSACQSLDHLIRMTVNFNTQYALLSSFLLPSLTLLKSDRLNACFESCVVIYTSIVRSIVITGQREGSFRPCADATVVTSMLLSLRNLDILLVSPEASLLSGNSIQKAVQSYLRLAVIT